jgi:demethylmenaquinone methyltransferase / 2-methoxy-6-polyprenyl-1,4-benzoquinol methylase
MPVADMFAELYISMYKQEDIKPYNEKGEKGIQVEQMFNSIAHSYDFLNHKLSMGIDYGWRKKAVRQLYRFAPKKILDVATGTGDFAILAAHTLTPDQLIGADISEGMMEIGRKKVKQKGLDKIITFQKEDCMNLSFDDNTFDAITVAFGIRNFADLDKGLKEMCRVLKPEGHLSIVELCEPAGFPMKQLFGLYSHSIMPTIGRLVSKDVSAYKYLIATMEAFPQGERMVEILLNAGFCQARFHRMTFGICTMYLATK